MSSGIPAGRLSDEELRHDLLQLKQKQADIRDQGTPDQQLNHERRTAELETEFVRRFGDTGAPRADGQSEPSRSSEAGSSTASGAAPGSAEQPTEPESGEA